MATSASAFAEHRDLLVGIAYRILGSVSDAEDVVQDAWLRWSGQDQASIEQPRAFLARVVTNLAIDRLRRRQARREEYYGEWLPEPVATLPDVAEDVERTDALSTAMLLVLETLSPLERAVFVLREAFGFSHAEIGELVGRGEAAVRQLAHRAREHVEAGQPRFAADHVAAQAVTDRFLSATASGDVAGLMRVLAPGVTLVTDSGGTTRAPLLPVLGADRVARFLKSARERAAADQRLALTWLNGWPGVVVYEAGAAVAAATFEVAAGQVQRIYLVANRDKLRGVHVTLAASAAS